MTGKVNVGIRSGKTEIDYSISCARLVALCCIFACHVMQRDHFASDINGAHIEWAFWFNVGVQMFLFISGYLYGKREKIDAVEFYKKGFSKLLVDYYLFICVMLVVMFFSPLVNLNEVNISGLLTLSGSAKGLEHLWFVPLILFCYLLVPVCSEIINALDRHNDAWFSIEVILLVFIFHVVVKHFFNLFSPAWMNCFVIGMLFSRIERRRTIRVAFTILSVVACLLIIPVQFRIDYSPHNDLPFFFASRYEHFVQYGHVFLGIVLVNLIRFLYKKWSAESKKHHILDWSDKHSYDVYLVHHVFVQSVFACVEFISLRWIAIPMAIALTILSAILLHAVSDFMRNESVNLCRRVRKQGCSD